MEDLPAPVSPTMARWSRPAKSMETAERNDRRPSMVMCRGRMSAAVGVPASRQGRSKVSRARVSESSDISPKSGRLVSWSTLPNASANRTHTSSSGALIPRAAVTRHSRNSSSSCGSASPSRSGSIGFSGCLVMVLISSKTAQSGDHSASRSARSRIGSSEMTRAFRMHPSSPPPSARPCRSASVPATSVRGRPAGRSQVSTRTSFSIVTSTACLVRSRSPKSRGIREPA